MQTKLAWKGLILPRLIWLFTVLPAFVFVLSGYKSERAVQQQLKWVQSQLQNPANGKVLFAAHRGDWRNAPENSLQSLRFCIEKGFDIVECDLKKTKDGHLIIMHDKTIDRTTTGTGKPEAYLLSELKALRLRNATGHATEHTIPTFEEFLGEAKGKIVLCIDKGFEYFDDAMKLVDHYKMRDQIIYNIPAITLDSLKALSLQRLGDDLILNILGVPLDTAKAKVIAESYRSRRKVILHPTFSTDTVPMVKWMGSLKAKGYHIWLNALWPEHNGGHDDDRAVEQNLKDESWGWLLNAGVTIIQTDRPAELKEYLMKKKVHPKF